MLELSFKSVICAIKKFKIGAFDLVIGIGKGGVVPAYLIANKIGCEARICNINYRNKFNIPRYSNPVLLNKCIIPRKTKKILIVDDVSVSGKTLKLAQGILKNYRTRTLVFVGEADHVIFPKIKSCVKWPWGNSLKISCK